MFCRHCGTENEDGAKFCKKCGKELAVPVTEGTQAATQQVTPQQVTPQQVATPAKPLPIKAIAGVVAAVAVFIIAFVVIKNRPTTIDIDKYVEFEANGYDGFGTVRAKIDWDAIEKKYGSKLKYDKKAEEEYKTLLAFTTPFELVKDSVSIELEKENSLSNGEEIPYTCNVEEEVEQVVNVKIKHKDSTYKVAGLTEVETFDPFKDVTVEFSGIGPAGTVEFDYTGSELGYSDFSFDKTSGLSNGDKVTVSISDRAAEYCAENYGKVPGTKSMEYTVSGLKSYINGYADLTEDFISTVKSEAEDSIYAYTASSYNSSSSLTGLEYAGYILLTAKDSNTYYEYNNLYVVYKGLVSSSEDNFPATTVYFPVRFKNILSGDEGLTFGSNEGIVGSSSLGNNMWYSTKGYVNPLTCYIEIVEANRDEYSAECGDGFEAYSEYELIEKIADISEDYKKTLVDDAKDTVESYIAKEYSDRSKVEDLKLAGEIMLFAKNQGTDFANNNYYYVVYSATVSNEDEAFEPTTVYYPVSYSGVVKLPGDEYMITAKRGIVGSSSFEDSWYYTDGYTDGKEMYSEIVTSSRDNYTYEVTDELKKFE